MALPLFSTGGGGFSGSSGVSGSDTFESAYLFSQRSGLNKTIYQGIDPVMLAVAAGVGLLVFLLMRK